MTPVDQTSMILLWLINKKIYDDDYEDDNGYDGDGDDGDDVEGVDQWLNSLPVGILLY